MKDIQFPWISFTTYLQFLVKILKEEDIDCWLRLDWVNLWIRFPVVILEPSIFLSIKYYHKFCSEISVDISQFTFSYIPKSLL